MPRRRKPKAIPDIRRKCHATGRVLKVECRYIELPAGFEARGKKTITDYEDIKGAIIKNYSSHEAAESVHGKDSFTNTYTEDDFLRT